MHKLKLTVVFLMILFITGCKKDTLQLNEINDIDKIKSILSTKITSKEFSEINWDCYYVKEIDNRTNFFSIPFKNNKIKKISGSKLNDNFTIIIEELSKSNNSVEILHRDITSGKTKTTKIDLTHSASVQNKSQNTNSVPGTYIIESPPPAVNWTIFYLFNSEVSNPNPTIVYTYIDVDENSGGGAGGGGNFNNYIIFESLSEATEFFMWVEDANPYEKALIGIYPVEGLAIYRNSKKAIEKAQTWYSSHPGSQNSLTDGKADAIRHAYWNALNKSSVGETIAQLFADAHEFGSTRPPSIPQSLWDLQRSMDLHNNQVGRNIANTQGWGFFTLSSTIWEYFYYGYDIGDLSNLKYICKETNPFTLKFFTETCP